LLERREFLIPDEKIAIAVDVWWIQS